MSLGALVTVIFWGVSFVATKIALRELSPIEILTVRFGLGSFFLWLILLLKKRCALPAREILPILALLGFLGIFFHNWIQAVGLRFTTAMNSGILIATCPIFIAVLSRLFFGERFNFVRVVGMTIGFSGVVILITGGKFSLLISGSRSSLGDILILLSAFNWAVYSIIGKRVSLQGSPLINISYIMLFGWIMLLPFSLRSRTFSQIWALSYQGWFWVAFLGVFCSGLSYFLWYEAMARREAVRIGAYLYLEPFFTVLAAMTILAEPLSLAIFVGGGLILLGVFMAAGKKNPRRLDRALRKSHFRNFLP